MFRLRRLDDGYWFTGSGWSPDILKAKEYPSLMECANACPSCAFAEVVPIGAVEPKPCPDGWASV